ncbi:ABC transporter permease [Kribbella shirazensis]|uniref:ABC-type transport system involved in multi-copper enzyme maturation permease subunit n=1 Tax=Kribbella shirazensis TaxID=1105143 RepID=A0A7X5VDG9_9ACTN|nr:ABC transporter permease [Kribbella shirazensis]NIK59220.1 ABC-type transport system involved in multi-copper enzyme maturation permease subunit [Kribbella shirazensis]
MTRLLEAEFTKLFSTKLWMWLLLGAIGLTTLFVSVTIGLDGSAGNPNPPLSTPQGQRNLFGVAGASSALAVVLGIVAMTSEYRHETVTPTFLATPRRRRVVVAKLFAYALAGLGFGLVNVLATVALALPWLSARNIDVSLTANGIPRTMIGVVLGLGVYTVLGVGVGALLRNQVAAIVGALVYLFVVEGLVSALPRVRDYYKYLPGGAFSGLVDTYQPNVQFLAGWQGGLLLLAYGAAFAALGTALTIRRDVT